MPTAPLKRESLVEQLHTRLVDRIQSGELLPGTRLKIEELAVEFGVSRTPVREAISKLTQDGFVVQRHNSGPRVAAFNRRDVAEIIRTNEVLFDGVMDCLRQLTGRELDLLAVRLAAVTREQEAALRIGDSGQFHAHSVEFHLVLIEFCPNRTLGELARQTQYKINLCALYYQSQGRTREAGLTDHRAILAALEARDVDRAARLMRAHNREALERFLAESPDRPAGGGEE